MSYQSPIEVIMGQMNMFYENEIYKAVQNVGVNVDKNELLKALRYDREQYQKGYADRDSEIVRCKDCKRGKPGACGYGVDCDGVWHDDNWFCADGKGKIK